MIRGNGGGACPSASTNLCSREALGAAPGPEQALRPCWRRMAPSRKADNSHLEGGTLITHLGVTETEAGRDRIMDHTGPEPTRGGAGVGSAPSPPRACRLVSARCCPHRRFTLLLKHGNPGLGTNRPSILSWRRGVWSRAEGLGHFRAHTPAERSPQNAVLPHKTLGRA